VKLRTREIDENVVDLKVIGGLLKMCEGRRVKVEEQCCEIHRFVYCVLKLVVDETRQEL
jgi:hypothetical protein